MFSVDVLPPPSPERSADKTSGLPATLDIQSYFGVLMPVLTRVLLKSWKSSFWTSWCFIWTYTTKAVWPMAQYLNRNLPVVYYFGLLHARKKSFLAIATWWRIWRMRPKLIAISNAATVHSGFTKTRNHHQIKTLSSSRVTAVREFNSTETFLMQHNHTFPENINHNKWTGKGTALTHIQLQNKRNLSWFYLFD